MTRTRRSHSSGNLEASASQPGVWDSYGLCNVGIVDWRLECKKWSKQSFISVVWSSMAATNTASGLNMSFLFGTLLKVSDLGRKWFNWVLRTTLLNLQLQGQGITEWLGLDGSLEIMYFQLPTARSACSGLHASWLKGPQCLP